MKTKNRKTKSVSQKIRKILLLGSGGLRIGQAGEFDYSGSQAIKVFKDAGIYVVLMNPNIATVQTDTGFADKVYFLPLTIEYAKQVIASERPDAIALSFGGQTALNLGLELDQSGILKQYKIKVLGTPVSIIRDTEDRALFTKRLSEIQVKTARSIATTTRDEAIYAAESIGYPIMMRSGFALGGQGSGIVLTRHELSERVTEVFRSVPQILIEENLTGWKEIEYEVVRDTEDNCITVCNMENIDPMGIHTGESIVVAPSQTLSNDEYHNLREIAIKTIRHLGIVGECNIQYALNPQNGDYRVIEVNARLSRSSALASKATGYPLAAVAANIAIGRTLPQIQNSVTGKTTACFEPALDYIVMKIPRWDLIKFDSANLSLGTEMKSVGEVMAIGRSFEEVLQKAIRSLNIGATGFQPQQYAKMDCHELETLISTPTTTRIFQLAAAMDANIKVSRIHELTGIDEWFLRKMANIRNMAMRLKEEGITKENLREAKMMGFSDMQIATTTLATETIVRSLRKKYRIMPVVKQIDTLAGEFPATTNYLYLTYHGSEHDVLPGNRKAIAIIGSGPYCIGSSVEFDWSCAQALKTLRDNDIPSIMINSNPETVSTDYDESDRLYFEEITLERILDISDFEKQKGTIISTGGQIANNLAMSLRNHNIKILGTRAEDIDRAENRHVFSELLDSMHIDQPEWVEASSHDQAVAQAEKMGYPVLVRPSYVLSGAAMRVVFDENSLRKFLLKASDISGDHPVVVSKFIENAREIEIDGVAKDGELIIYAISEHVENAGTHSGDATVVLPPQRTYLETIRRSKHITKDIIKALRITGPFNIQFIAKANRIQVIECNVRASRSFPFVSKTTGYNFINIAVRAMLGMEVGGEYQTVDLDHVAVKSPQFSFARIKGADPKSGVEMASTGEVACFGKNFDDALIKSMLASGMRLPAKGILVSLGGTENKIKLLPTLQRLHAMRFALYGTEHTAGFLIEQGIPCERVFKISENKEPGVISLLGGDKIDLIINIPTKAFERESTDGYAIRRFAVDNNIPLITNRQLAEAFIGALKSDS